EAGRFRGLGGAIMRIQAAVQPSVSNAAPARRTQAGGFSVSNDNTAPRAEPAQAAAGINGIDALPALQAVEDPAERRRRFARRGSQALDILEALKVQIIEGRIDLETLARLEGMFAELTERSGEASLDGVLDAIGMRVAVELAKRRPRPSA